MKTMIRTAVVGGLAASAIAVPSALPTPIVEAAGDPDVVLTKAMPEEVLYGDPITATLTATTAAGETTDGYNLSFTDTLPEGAVFAGSDPSPSRIIDLPGANGTAIVWENVADLLAGASVSLSYTFTIDETEFDIGDDVVNSAGAYVSSNPRDIPDFDSEGANIANAQTDGSDTAIAATTLMPFELRKTAQGDENELLRGVHDHKTIFTLTVDNNQLVGSSDFTLVDYLPAGLEFLECGDVDNSSPGEEYPTSGRIDGTPAPTPIMPIPCPVPTSVTTVTDPVHDGTALPPGVYTRVEWDAATLIAASPTDDLTPTGLAPTESFSIYYVAAVPLRENVQASLTDTAANLDNNTGPLTYDEQELVNRAFTGGTTDGDDYTDDDRALVTAEDLSIHKNVDNGTFTHGASAEWEFTVESSEYHLSTDTVITVTDTIPNGLEYTSSSLPPSAGPTPGPVGGGPVDGTQIVEWQLPAFTAPNGVVTWTLATTALADYRAPLSGPVAANDAWSNTVVLTADATIMTDNDGSSTPNLPVPDDSAASQAADDVTIVKEVADPVAGTVTCGDGSALTFTEDVAYDYRAGDRVCWRLTVEFPLNLDTLSPLIKDYLPGGYAYESWDFGANNDFGVPGGGGAPAGVNFTSTVDDIAEGILIWDLEDAEPVGSTFEVVVSTLITGGAALTNADITRNLMKFSYQNTANSLFQDRSDADARYVEPVLSIAKGHTPGGRFLGGETVDYTVTVTNQGFLDADNATITDALPAGITCDDVTLTAVGAPAAVTCPSGTSTITWTGIDIAAATEEAPVGSGVVETPGSTALTYSVLLPITLNPNTSLTNTATLVDYQTATNTGTPNDWTSGETATDTIQIVDATIAKTRTTGTTQTGNNAASQATIGETITYTVTATIPGGTTTTSGVISDTMPAGIRLDNATVTLNGGAAPGTFVSDATGFTLTLPSPYTNNAGSDVFVFTLTTTVTDVPGNVGPGSRNNVARLVWSAGNRTANASTNIVEPSPTVSKANNTGDDLVTPGEFVQYTLTVATTGSAANDVVIVDTLPDDVIPLVGPGPAADVADGGTVASGGEWDLGTRTITWDQADIAGLATVSAGSPVTIVYDTRINNPLTGDIRLTNNVDLTATSMPGADPDERTYTASATDTVVAPSISVLTKTADPTTATVGDTVDYTVTVGIPADVIGYDLTILDDLPAGTEYESLVSVSCSEPAAAPCAPARSASELSADGDTGTIGFYVGDVNPGSPEAQTITLVYRVRVLDDDVNVVAPADLDNSARSLHNITNKIAGTPTGIPAGPFDNESAERVGTVGVVEPTLVIDKDIAGQTGDSDTRRHQPGDTATFTVRVENTGTSPAYDVVVTDTPDSRLTDFTPAAGVSTSALTDGDQSDGTLGWFIAGPIQPGAANAITLTYTLDIPNTLGPADEVVSGFEVTNTADIPQYFGHPETTRTANPTIAYREYGAGDYDVTPDTVNIELDLARIGDRVWYDINGDGVQDLGEPGLNGVDITVTYFGPNGVAGGGDDETFTAITSGNGDWQVIELPGGAYRVDVDSTDVPAGMSPSWDLDDLLASPDGDWDGTLAQNGDRDDVDAGFTGSGSIGNLVWFDQDLSGAQNSPEPGLGGIDVTLVWAGPDNDLGTPGDNVTYTDTTTATGAYLFEQLPAGDFQITVDGSDLPTGMSFVSDPDAGTADGVSTTTLTATGPGVDDLTQDFGAAGSLTIGDTVYLDRDGSGDQAVTGEPGLEGVTVTLTYAGADGILGNADDIVFTDVTDTNGEYGFANLPPEDYRVTVTGPLPSGSVNSDDPDTAGTGDSTSVVALTVDDEDQDFGYSADSEIGDRVWWDLDRDGVQDAGEPGINGATITVTYLGPDGLAAGGDDLVFTTTTSGDGDWSITNIPDGEYTVAVTAGIPAGFDQTYDDDGIATPSTSSTTLTTLDDDQDFGYAGNSSIGDTIWLDRDGDGTINGDETGIPDVTVTVTWAGPDGDLGTTGDNEVFTRVTDDDGLYSVVGLPAGTYEVEVDTATLPGNVSVTYDVVNGTTTPSSTAVVTLGTAEDLDTVDFGYQGDSSIGDTIYWDRNGDGDQDTPGDSTDEPGLEGVTVQLVWAGPDGDLLTTDDNATYTTLTDSDGNYLFDGLPEGEYEVNVIAGLPAGMTNTDDEDGDNDSSTPVTLGAADDHDTADFGYNGSATIGDTVYLDLDGNAEQAATGEPGVPGQTVTLNFEGADGTLGTPDDIVLATVTDANGEYEFTNLPDGEFRVTVVGGITDDASNSEDPDGGTPNQSDVVIAGGVDDLDQDFGYEGDNALGDTIWWDMNRDGVIDPVADEPRLAGVDVRITYAGADGILGGAGAADDIVISTETTGAAGDYSVDRLPNGDYSVEVITSTLPAGMDNTYDADGGTATPNDISFVNLPGATDNDLQDFGYAGTGSIGDLVYFDRDGDGVRGAPLDEPGIAGVEVTLTFAGADGILGGAGAADDIVVTQIAGSDGEYDFTGLPAGDYTVEVTNGIPTTAVNSDDPDVPGEPDVGDSSSSVTLAAGEDNDDQDFGYDVEAGLGDRVWWDFDRDGVQDEATPGSPREPGINGVEVTVTYFGLDGVRDLPGDPDPDDEVFVTTTSGDGNWMVNDIPEGNYAVELTGGLPAGFTNTYDPDTGLPGADGNAELAGHTGLNVAQDFGLAGDSSIGDTVWLDLDGDGTINGQEVGLEGVTVNLTWGGPDGIVGGANGADDVVIAVVTDANGNYSFEGLPAGEYVVTVDPASLPDGLTPSFDLDGDITTPDGSTPVTLGAAEDIDTVDFGYQGSSSIGDTIFFDRDRDGTQQVGGNGDEPGLAGVVVTLTWEGENGIFGDADDEMFTTFTDTDGFYEFTGLPAGQFQVDVDTTPTGGLPVAVTNTVDEDGNNNSSTPVVLGVDDVHDTTDFGYAGVASIGDTIFIDLDGDGEQTGDEPGVPGQTVTLTGDQGTFTTVTNADGMYSFDNLPDGDYIVTVVGGIVDTAVNTGDPDSAVGAGDSTAAVTISGGVPNDEQDFGYQGTAALGDTLYFDVDDDGVDDGAATEPRLDGVDVVVVWFGPDGVAGGGDDVVIPTDPTNSDGVYNVTGLPAGTYSVTPDEGDILPGLEATVDADGGADGTSTVTLADGEVDLDQDFAYTGTGSIGDTVWLDLNDDGFLDDGEPGLEGVTVTITWLGPDGVAGGDDDVVYTTTVADDGSYLVENLPAGEYTVELSGVPGGLTGATSSATTLAPGEDDLDQDFPFIGSASVGDTVFLDVDDDGVQDSGEPGVGGVTVTVTSSGSDGELGTDDDLVIVTTTAPDGTYTVTGLPSGPTQVAVDPGTLLPGTVPTSDADGDDPSVSTIDLEAGENDVDQDFAIAGDGVITGTVIDEGDGSGIPNVTITITYDGPDGPLVIVTTSGPDGGYEVTGLPVGDYTVEILMEDQPDGYIPTAPTSVDVTVTASDPTPPNVDFPFVEPGSIGRTIFIDMNNNGVQDAGEGGASGVTVTLLDEDGNVVATTETDEDGNFLFDDLPPGTYTVVLDPDTFPHGLGLTVDPDGNPDGRFVVTIGPGEDSRAAVFGLAPPVLPRTGSGVGVLLRMAALLLAAGAVLMLLRRRRDDDVITMKL
ncbi:SdrD B-like domain-containing protein [Ilumatobacter coccineus]|uniref:alpha-amylase n=1 Tax=Ilumatobacter coccineus (strain NBRC 103263 / KCTC 29153 / YM16-304) TaxID=1313172 RepID=A0A6C7EBC9_ILUCY|nr:SdrD B-like domain-containing protein [Ilumatobacter coccineus]BAN03690.1 hypothetical protein YM304_33760 [Ilumatobacter coccineus YM16-304]